MTDDQAGGDDQQSGQDAAARPTAADDDAFNQAGLEGQVGRSVILEVILVMV
ncbi:MAG: hypothetical protein IPM01_30970 [Burkholderiaceae bacterium]|nr:hypothetical protein [Burkholderiaceae bacterium]